MEIKNYRNMKNVTVIFLYYFLKARKAFFYLLFVVEWED